MVYKSEVYEVANKACNRIENEHECVTQLLDNEIYSYLSYKIGLDRNSFKKWLQNFNNIKLKGVELHKHSYPDRDEYFDTNYCFMIHYRPNIYSGRLNNEYLVRCWSNDKEL